MKIIKEANSTAVLAMSRQEDQSTIDIAIAMPDKCYKCYKSVILLTFVYSGTLQIYFSVTLAHIKNVAHSYS